VFVEKLEWRVLLFWPPNGTGGGWTKPYPGMKPVIPWDPFPSSLELSVFVFVEKLEWRVLVPNGTEGGRTKPYPGMKQCPWGPPCIIACISPSLCMEWGNDMLRWGILSELIE